MQIEFDESYGGLRNAMTHTPRACDNPFVS